MMVSVIGLGIMNLKFNGKIISVPEQTTLQNFISELDLPKLFAIELNGTIIYKEQYCKIVLKNDDEIEIVTFTGGG